MERRGSKGWDEFTSNDIRVGGDYMEMGWIEEREGMVFMMNDITPVG